MKGSWQHGGPIPARYRGLLQELRQEIAAKPDLERRAKKVHHELDTVALGRWAHVNCTFLVGTMMGGW